MSGSGCTNFSPECTIDLSFYAYIPSLPANAAYAAIFGLSLVLHLVQGIIWRKAWWGFAAAMILGNAGEAVGYVGRILNHKNPFDQTGFLIQICCITIAPAFLSAGIYICLGTIVRICDPSISRIPPRFFAYIFIPCDLVSLVIQAVGGAMASIATTNYSSPDKGDNIMIAGVSFQVLTLSVFLILSVDYALRLRRSTRVGEHEIEVMREAGEKFVARVIKLNKKLGLEKWNTVNATLAEKRGVDRKSWTMRERRLFHAFLWALTISTIAIFIRCVYRVVEMSFGWSGVVISNEKLFIGFEGVCVSIAVLVLNVFHPGLCLKKPGVDEAEMSSDHAIQRLVGDVGLLSCPSSLDSHADEPNLEKPFSRRFSAPKVALDLPGITLTSNRTTVHSSSSFGEEELHEEQQMVPKNKKRRSRTEMLRKSGVDNIGRTPKGSEEESPEKLQPVPNNKNRMTLTDILRESRVDNVGNKAMDEGWAGQDLRDNITLNRESVMRQRPRAEKESQSSRTLKLVRSTSVVDLLDSAELR